MDFDEQLKKDISQYFQKLFPSSLKKPTIHIGTNALSGKKLYLPIEDEKKGLSSTHTYIPGRSGVGKSKFFEGIARDIINVGYGLIVLDGKGDLYDNLADYCALMNLKDKTILIDPNEDEWSVGINYLELLGDTSPAALAGLILEALKKFFKEDEEYKPWLEEWTPAALVPLIKAKFTLLELFEFLNLQNSAFRETILKELNDTFYTTKWDNFVKDFKLFERAKILNVLKTRASTFWEDETLKAIFGQQKTTIDWLRVMNEGGIVLARLGRTPKLPEKTAGMIGAAILHQITTIAPERGQGERRPCFFMVDEFQKFATADFADALDRMRGYGIHFILSHQHRSQLEKEAPEILDSIDTNCRNKIVFAISRKDTEDMALELFTGLIHKEAEKVKDEIWQTKYKPVKTYEEITSYHESDISGASSTDSFSGSQAVLPSGDVIVTDISGGASGDFSAHTSGTNTQQVPWYDYEEFQEVSSRPFFQVEEIKERFIAWVENQDDRHAQWKFKSKKPIPIVTPFIEPVILTETIRRKFKEKVYSRCARPTHEINLEIEQRVQRFLQAKNNTENEQIEPIEHTEEDFIK